MNKQRVITWLIGVLSVVTVSGLLWAQPGSQGKGPKGQQGKGQQGKGGGFGKDGAQ